MSHKISWTEYNRACLAHTRYRTLYNKSEQDFMLNSLTHFQPNDQIILSVMINDITLGMCGTGFYYDTNLVEMIVDLFTRIKSPVLYEIVLAYINRFK
jgi:hypothetical protein